MTDGSIKTLFHCLQRFSEMPAFELLSAAASRTYFGGTSAALGTLTVSGLAELSSAELARLGLSGSDCARIIAQIGRILPAHREVTESGRASDSTPPEAFTRSSTDVDQTLSSVAQEQILTQTLTELATWPALATLGNTPLGAFWTDAAVRAPFEELITLNQLAKMSSRSLLAKRSMTSPKILAITNAVKRAMREGGVETKFGKGAYKAATPSSPLSKLSKSEPGFEDLLTKRLLAAALAELTAAQRARVLKKVALGEELIDKSKNRKKNRPRRVSKAKGAALKHANKRKK